MKQKKRIHLCLAHMSETGAEQRYVKEAFDTNWVVPLGPNVDAFEQELEHFVCSGSRLMVEDSSKSLSKRVVALSSGTAAVHLALIACGVGPGDEVIVQSFTFCASTNPVAYLGATPVMVDSERDTWNMDPELLELAIKDRIAVTGRKPKAIMPVALYGMPYEIERIMEIAERYDIPVIEDAAEGFGSRYKGQVIGTFGNYGVLSFNGNKMITTSGGGALVCGNSSEADTIMWLATQAREAYPYYQHEAIGYNYRLSNVCAGIGRGQMTVLEDHLKHHKHVQRMYEELLKDVPGITVHSQPGDSSEFRVQSLESVRKYDSNYWLCTILLDPELKVKGEEHAYQAAVKGAVGGVASVVHGGGSLHTNCEPNKNVEAMRVGLDELGIEVRPLWKPMHAQPVYRKAESGELRVEGLGNGVVRQTSATSVAYINGVSEEMFKMGLCLPSGPMVTDEDVKYIVESIKGLIEVGLTGSSSDIATKEAKQSVDCSSGYNITNINTDKNYINMEKRKISFSPPDMTEAEVQQVADTLRNGWITTGPKTKEFERRIAEYCHTEKAVCLNSATACMESILRVLGVGPGDEVITCAYTYTASASVACHVGAKVVLVDAQKDSVEMDYDQLEAAITERTKVVIPVDLGGIVCDYDRIYDVVERKRHLFRPANEIQKMYGRVIVLADAAHAFGARWHGKVCGEIADFTSFSFHAVKNLTTAEGGALTWKCPDGISKGSMALCAVQSPSDVQGSEAAIQEVQSAFGAGSNVQEVQGSGTAVQNGAEWDEKLYKEFQLLSLHGQSKDALAKTRLGAWEYDIVAPYYKCNMTDIMAGIGLAQLERYPQLLARRKEIVKRYDEALKDLNVKMLEHYGEDYQGSGHLYIVRMLGLKPEQRNEVIVKMAERGVACNVHYKPLPMMTAYKAMGYDIKDYPNAYHLFENEITLPLHTKLTDEDVEYVIASFKEALSEV